MASQNNRQSFTFRLEDLRLPQTLRLEDPRPLLSLGVQVKVDERAASELRFPSSAPFPPLEDIEVAYVKHVVAALGGKKGEAARVLGISHPTLTKKLGESHRETED